VRRRGDHAHTHTDTGTHTYAHKGTHTHTHTHTQHAPHGAEPHTHCQRTQTTTYNEINTQRRAEERRGERREEMHLNRLDGHDNPNDCLSVDCTRVEDDQIGSAALHHHYHNDQRCK